MKIFSSRQIVILSSLLLLVLIGIWARMVGVGRQEQASAQTGEQNVSESSEVTAYNYLSGVTINKKDCAPGEEVY